MAPFDPNDFVDALLAPGALIDPSASNKNPLPPSRGEVG